MKTYDKAELQRAFDRCAAADGPRRVRRIVRGMTYDVLGRSATYTVRVVERGDLLCSCPAAMRDRPCWHAAAVYLVRAADRAAELATQRAASESATAAQLPQVVAAADADWVEETPAREGGVEVRWLCGCVETRPHWAKSRLIARQYCLNCRQARAAQLAEAAAQR